MPEERAGPRIVGVDTLARVDDELRTGRRSATTNGVVYDIAALAAIRLPPLLAGLLVHGEQIRRRRVIAQQDQRYPRTASASCRGPS